LNSWAKGDKGHALAGLFGGVGKAVVGAAALLLGLAFLAAAGPISAPSPAIDASSTVRVTDLPKEARETLSLIKQGGPFPYSRDGVVFANREGRLPHASRGTYREYTVRTPGSHDRGARRIITARSSQFWYTADHYRSFRRIVE
jgi:ribonuclease T1